MDRPIVSAIMPTYNRRDFARQAIAYFNRQDYPASARELIVVDDGEQSVNNLAAGVENVRYFRLDRRAPSIGTYQTQFRLRPGSSEKPSFTGTMTTGKRTPPHHRANRRALGTDVCGLANVLYFEPARRAWEYRHLHKHCAWVSGNSMCYRKAFWERTISDINVGEDARFLWSGRQMQLVECPG